MGVFRAKKGQFRGEKGLFWGVFLVFFGGKPFVINAVWRFPQGGRYFLFLCVSDWKQEG
jgi:hypothetical protein